MASISGPLCGGPASENRGTLVGDSYLIRILDYTVLAGYIIAST